MNIGISNIAWNPDENIKVYKLMNKYNIPFLEIAPTKIFGSEPYIAPSNDISNFLNELSFYSLKISSLQSLLYGKNTYKVFGATSQETLNYLKKSIDLSQQLYSPVLIFGSPKNRSYESNSTYLDEATTFFSSIGDYASNKCCKFCIEVNPPCYGTNFLTSQNEQLNFLSTLNNKGLGLHIDLGSMLLNNEDFETIYPFISYIDHIHLSLPYLEQITRNNIKLFSPLVPILKGYSNCLSIEMKTDPNISSLNSIEETLYHTSLLFE